MSRAKLRIGCVPYLNGVPLTWGLCDRPNVEVVTRVPSELARLLREGELEVGLIPVAAYLRGTGDALLPGMSISSRGRVQSVSVFLDKPPGQVETLATDEGSRSSAALAQVIFRRQYGVNPIQVPCPPDLEPMLARADAALLIGDAALRQRNSNHDQLDLGEAWQELTRLPFTYATWVTRPGAPVDELCDLLLAVRRAAEESMPELIEQSAKMFDFPVTLVEFYLRESIHYDLSEEHLCGIRRFRDYGFELGVFDQRRELYLAAG